MCMTKKGMHTIDLHCLDLISTYPLPPSPRDACGGPCTCLSPQLCHNQAFQLSSFPHGEAEESWQDTRLFFFFSGKQIKEKQSYFTWMTCPGASSLMDSSCFPHTEYIVNILLSHLISALEAKTRTKKQLSNLS